MRGETDQWKFTEEWIDSGLATFSAGKLKMNLMSGSADARKERRQTQARQTHFWAFTDGAGPRDKTQKAAEMAGFGGAIIPATTTEEADIVTFACGILHGDREGETMGATVATNNSGELCAIQGACRKAITTLKRGRPHGGSDRIFGAGLSCETKHTMQNLGVCRYGNNQQTCQNSKIH